MISRLNAGLNDDFNDFICGIFQKSVYSVSRLVCVLYQYEPSRQSLITSNLFNARQGPGSYPGFIMQVVYIQHFDSMGLLSCCMVSLRIFPRSSVYFNMQPFLSPRSPAEYSSPLPQISKWDCSASLSSSICLFPPTIVLGLLYDHSRPIE